MKKSLRSLSNRPIHHIKPKSCPPSRRIMCNRFSGQTAGGASDLSYGIIARWHFVSHVEKTLRCCWACDFPSHDMDASHVPGPVAILLHVSSSVSAWSTVTGLLTNYSIKKSQQLSWEGSYITAAANLIDPLQWEGLHQLRAWSFITVTGPVMVMRVWCQ